MTREEAIQELKKGIPRSWEWGRDFGTFENAIDTVVKELEQKTNIAETKIKQDSILDKICDDITYLTEGKAPERIWNVDVFQIIDKYREKYIPITHWKPMYSSVGGTICQCSKCKFIRTFRDKEHQLRYKYCPNCGAKMESEVK